MDDEQRDALSRERDPVFRWALSHRRPFILGCAGTVVVLLAVPLWLFGLPLSVVAGAAGTAGVVMGTVAKSQLRPLSIELRALDVKTRRAIRQAIDRGEVPENPANASLASEWAAAELRQQRFMLPATPLLLLAFQVAYLMSHGWSFFRSLVEWRVLLVFGFVVLACWLTWARSSPKLRQASRLDRPSPKDDVH